MGINIKRVSIFFFGILIIVVLLVCILHFLILILVGLPALYFGRVIFVVGVMLVVMAAIC